MQPRVTLVAVFRVTNLYLVGGAHFFSLQLLDGMMTSAETANLLVASPSLMLTAGCSSDDFENVCFTLPPRSTSSER